ncbi:growth arrest-specific protein 7 isoform X1 [Neophocaena asiaeorientalis asiaeorientalis]|uniref:Growth arrest-specific protein 7 n=2 Tax=Neophocaena asiaeorientalis asiaeorientalis TaxID=1706337 RepID=A0A341BNE7_NEOAA|nr:growth arrest-specific protein 7 isoform X1 [Neophocaena asiaeorientalis asiaeorientalis]
MGWLCLLEVPGEARIDPIPLRVCRAPQEVEARGFAASEKLRGVWERSAETCINYSWSVPTAGPGPCLLLYLVVLRIFRFHSGSWRVTRLLQKPGMVPPPPGEESQTVVLPPGWQSYLSPQGRRYYVNTATNETTWERPSSSPGIPASPGPHRSSLPLTVNGYHTSGTPAHPPETAHMSVRKSTGDSQNLGSSSPGKKQSKENTITVNCVTFPHPDTMPEQQLLKPTEWSYCDYFWADKKDPQGNGTMAGFELLLQKQLKGKQMQKEMSEFIRERIKIEEEYAKNLAKLSQNSLAAQEEGSLGEAWAQVKKSLADEAEVHLKFSAKLHSEVEKPLMNFRENFKKDMKKCDHHIADLRKQLASRYAAVEKARKALTERQRDLEMKTQQLEIKLSNKTEEDIKKARRKSTQAGDDLMRCVDLYNQAQSKWFEEMVTTTLELERLEVERVEMIRQHLCQYTQLRHETDMFNQSSSLWTNCFEKWTQPKTGSCGSGSTRRATSAPWTWRSRHTAWGVLPRRG